MATNGNPARPRRRATEAPSPAASLATRTTLSSSSTCIAAVSTSRSASASLQVVEKTVEIATKAEKKRKALLVRARGRRARQEDVVPRGSAADCLLPIHDLTVGWSSRHLILVRRVSQPSASKLEVEAKIAYIDSAVEGGK